MFCILGVYRLLNYTILLFVSRADNLPSPGGKTVQLSIDRKIVAIEDLIPDPYPPIIFLPSRTICEYSGCTHCFHTSKARDCRKTCNCFHFVSALLAQ